MLGLWAAAAVRRGRIPQRAARAATNGRSKDAHMGAPAAFRDEVAERFGVLPNFFCSAEAAPGLIDCCGTSPSRPISTTHCLHSSKSDCSFTSRASAWRATASFAILVSW